LSALALHDSQLGSFACWQAAYAELGIPIFPISSEKRPMVKSWEKLTAHASGQFALRPHLSGAAAFGFLPDRAGIVVLDIDSTDAAFASSLFERFGKPKILVRTASGKLHGYYSHSGEGRHIRPEGPSEPFDILGSGYCIAPGSVTPAGEYEIIVGNFDQLSSLAPMIGAPAFASPAKPPKQRLKDGDGRANALFNFLGSEARRCDNAEQLLDVATHYAEEQFADNLSQTDIERTVKSVWSYQANGRNFIGLKSGEGRKVILDHAMIGQLAKLGGIETIGVYTAVKARHPGKDPFCIANAMAWDDDIGASRRVMQKAKKAMLGLGIIHEVRPASKRHGPALFRWADLD